MIPGDRFPWQTHRSLAEVHETKKLRALSTKHAITPNWWGGPRLAELESRAVEPERDPPGGEAA